MNNYLVKGFYKLISPSGGYAKGFTLIELLVVVLIIGILASVALPQYQKAVMKSRVTAMQVAMSGVQKAEELYYLAHGQYAENLNLLDIGHSCTVTSHTYLPGDNSILACGGFFIDVLNGTYDSPPVSEAIYAYWCPSVPEDGQVQTCLANYDFLYTIWLNNSAHPGERTCQGRTSLGIEVCQTFQ